MRPSPHGAPRGSLDLIWCGNAPLGASALAEYLSYGHEMDHNAFGFFGGQWSGGVSALNAVSLSARKLCCCQLRDVGRIDDLALRHDFPEYFTKRFADH